MFFEDSFSNVVPLRAIVFQFLFVLVAIAIEALILYRLLDIDYKTSAQYAISVNLFSTIVGWIAFFTCLRFIPPGIKIQLISYIFFEQFFDNNWIETISPILILICAMIFFGTFWVKVKGLELLEFMLGKTDRKEQTPEDQTGRFRGRMKKATDGKSESKAYAIFVANACSFSAILLLLFVRFVEQSYQAY